MKPKHVLSVLTVMWVIFVVLEGISSVIRCWYSRKMNAAFKAVSGVVNYGKMVFMIILAVSNVMLFTRYADKR